MKVQAVFVQKPLQKTIQSSSKPRKRKRLQPANLQSVFPFGCAILGLFAGVLLYVLRQTLFSASLDSFYFSYFSAIRTSFAARLCGAVLPTLGTGLCFVFLGTSPFGGYAVLPMLTLRASAVGAVAAWLSGHYSAAGTMYYFACLFPAKALQLIGLSLLASKAIRLSNYIKSRLNRDSFQKESLLHPYCTACLPGFGCLLAAALTDVLLQQWFSSSFPLPLY